MSLHDLPERPVRRRPPSPVSVVHRLMRTTTQEIVDARLNAAGRGDRGRLAGLAGDIATIGHQLGGFLARNDTVLRDAGLTEQADLLAALDRRIRNALDASGARLVDPLGEPYLAVADVLDVRDRPVDADDQRLVVTRTISPALRLDDGELLRPAQVILGLRGEETATTNTDERNDA